jgi:hypothetical protein
MDAHRAEVEDDVTRDYGADTFRVYEMFMGPLEAVKPWNTNGMDGVHRFLERAWRLGTGPVHEDLRAYDDATRRLVHKTIKKVQRRGRVRPLRPHRIRPGGRQGSSIRRKPADHGRGGGTARPFIFPSPAPR